MAAGIHEQLRGAAGDLLEKESPPSHVRRSIGGERGYSPELWRIMAEVGWTALNVPEEHRGAGLGFADLANMLVDIEAGRALARSFGDADFHRDAVARLKFDQAR